MAGRSVKDLFCERPHTTMYVNAQLSHASHLQVGTNDQIFGSVQPSEITEFIERQTGQKLDASKMELPEIKTLGTYDASIKLHPEVIGTFKVQVTKAAA